VPLDPRAYPSEQLDGRATPWPPWICRGPNGGGHIKADFGAIDVHVERPPPKRDEVSWTCEFGVFIVSRAWLNLFDDLIDQNDNFVGDLLVDGAKLESWATIHGRLAPALASHGGSTRHCPNCGNVSTIIRGRAFFEDPAVIGKSLIANWNGIFIREDIVAERNIRPPKGAFKPSLVLFQNAAE
jgi:hypothetical protein